MKFFLSLLFLLPVFAKAQDSVLVITPSMFDKKNDAVYILGMDGWVFQPGNDSTWSKEKLNTTTWKKFKPTDLSEKIARKVLPPGYRFVTTGSSQTFKESFNSLIFALFLGIIVAYMVLGSQFNSFIDPVTVLLALPFSLSGAFLTLWMFGKSLNLYSMIGLLLLMGIVKKNSILLVEFTNHVRDRGETNVEKALMEACPDRLRPIIMTSLATVVGAIPAAMAFGPGAESRGPMALAVIGGVILSTILTLFVVPCFYSLFATQRREKISLEGIAKLTH